LQFSDEPFTMTLKATVNNPTYAAAAVVRVGGVDVPDLANRAQRHFIDPLELKPPVYLNPLLGGASFFSKMDVMIDDQKISSDSLEDRHFSTKP
jgi:hypothetical protein